MADLRLKCTFFPRFDTTSVSLRTPQSGEFCPLRILKVVVYYAFLEKVEESAPGALHNPLHEARLDSMLYDVADPSRNGLDAQNRQRQPRVGFGQFDCIRADYFDACVEPYKTFYEENRPEDIEAEYDWGKSNQLTPPESRRHLEFNARFEEDGEVAGYPNFLNLMLAFQNTGNNWRRFETQFPDEGWYALGLTRVASPVWAPPGLAANVWVGDIADGAGGPSDYWTLVDIYELLPVQLNRIRHIVSLDFASDAFIAPENTGVVFRPSPVPTPSTHKPMGIAARMARSPKKGRDPKERRNKILKPKNKLGAKLKTGRIDGSTFVRFKLAPNGVISKQRRDQALFRR
jgi:hypothetical protein